MTDTTIADIQAIAETGPTLVLFTAPTWCVPCRQFHPHWEKSKMSLDKITNFLEVDLGEDPETTFAQPIVKELGVLSVPSVYLFRDGQKPVHVQHAAVVPFVRFVEKASE